MPNVHLDKAKKTKFDEFYTQYADIEKEMNAYLEFDEDVFRGKTVLLPCDDPEWSNFTKYFAQGFERLGLRKLISTSYAPTAAIYHTKPTALESGSPQFNPAKTTVNGKIFTLRRDVSGDHRINVGDLEWEYLEGDGDYRSDEVTRLRDEADVIITNPPFSMFRDFLAWIVKADKRFVIIGNMNAITYKEVFPLIKGDRIWLGATGNGSDMVFGVPPGAVVAPGDREKAARLGYVGDYTRLGNSCWFTNLDHGRRHQPIPLMTLADNLRFSRHGEIKGRAGYEKYDNYDAIEVPYIDAIPSDYEGVMGVPISFLDRYNPDQFEILGFDGGDYPVTKTYGRKEKVVDGVHMKSNTGTGASYIRADSFGTGTYFDVGYPVKRIYKRLFIRHKVATK